MPASVQCWGLQDHERQHARKNMTKFYPSDHYRFDCPTESYHHRNRKSFRQAVRLTSLFPRGAGGSESLPPNPHRWPRKPRKSMGLHLHRYGNGNESWEYAQATAKFCGCIVFLPAQSSNRECCRFAPLLNTTRGNLCQTWHNLDTKPTERHCFSFLAYR